MNPIDIKKITLSEHQFKTFDKVRYSDTDRQGHVNNAVFSTFFETGRVELLYIPTNPLYDEGCSFVIASSKIDYLSEIMWPGTVEIGTSIIKIGNSSVHLIQSIYQHRKLVGTSDNITVQVDNETKRSKPLSNEAKEKLSNYLLSCSY